MILFATGLIVAVIAAIALYAFHTERLTTPTRWSLLLLLAGITLTATAFWTQRHNPSNTSVMTWTLLITGSVLPLAAGCGELVSLIVRSDNDDEADTDIVDSINNTSQAPSGDRA
ncbi:hypothetical protein BH93_27625 (plasmid) [Rhodococcoides fascians A25f]|uniref:hypothetical protein n=1 Tax=Rhodococcoides fascians TaxID=1828 RepID=UPI00068F7BB7|nr:hypothetical protein [Rhodococcus fascians]QII09343.1 hypothetical protein BH93_27625 [Rhodococcus fascians A25f]